MALKVDHVAAPWSVHQWVVDGHAVLELIGEHGFTIAQSLTANAYDEANFTLMKAAPELLEALQAVLQSCDELAHAAPFALSGVPNAKELHWNSVTARQRAALVIARATGK